MHKIKLQDLLNKHIVTNEFDDIDESIKGKIKLVIISTLKDRAYEAIKIMMNEENIQFTQNLYPHIATSTFYDFDLLKEQNRDTYAEYDEVYEYFEEIIQQIDLSFTDIITDYYDRTNLKQYQRIFTHDDKINQSTIKIES